MSMGNSTNPLIRSEQSHELSWSKGFDRCQWIDSRATTSI